MNLSTIAHTKGETELIQMCQTNIIKAVLLLHFCTSASEFSISTKPHLTSMIKTFCVADAGPQVTSFKRSKKRGVNNAGPQVTTFDIKKHDFDNAGPK